MILFNSIYSRSAGQQSQYLLQVAEIVRVAGIQPSPTIEQPRPGDAVRRVSSHYESQTGLFDPESLIPVVILTPPFSLPPVSRLLSSFQAVPAGIAISTLPAYSRLRKPAYSRLSKHKQALPAHPRPFPPHTSRSLSFHCSILPYPYLPFSFRPHCCRAHGLNMHKLTWLHISIGLEHGIIQSFPLPCSVQLPIFPA